MKLLFELAKQYPSIPQDEIIALLHAYNIDYQIQHSDTDVIIVNVKTDETRLLEHLSQRLAYTFIINEYLGSSPPQKQYILKLLKHTPRPNVAGSLAVRYRNRSTKISSQPIIQTIAQHYTLHRTVDLEHPDTIIRVVITDTAVHIGRQLRTLDRQKFDHRRVHQRPFFSPISLHPKLARALVNISRVQSQQTLLDPFCGTGGILLEAGILGVTVIGSDIEEKMIAGCKKTFDHYNIQKYQLFCCDIASITDHLSEVDAIVTDLPYGKSTTTKGENTLYLYDRAFTALSTVLKPGGIAVIGSSNQTALSKNHSCFTQKKCYEIPVHRSLTRVFAVYKK